MKKITTLEELHKIELDMFLDVVKFCDDNNITYYLSGGTLIGAIRHGGFIPWDDDIDLMMPRKDFEKFCRTYTNDRYKALRDGVFLGGNVLDTYTYMEFTFHEIEEHKCIYMDIFPIDGWPDSRILQWIFTILKELLIYCYVASKAESNKSTRYNNIDAGILNWKKHIRNIGKTVITLILGKTNDRLWYKLLDRCALFFNCDKAKYWGVILTGAHHKCGIAEVLPKESFDKDKKIKVKFEGYDVYIPYGYDTYLKQLYGDYMQMPPEDKRKSHHEFKAYWRNKE